jgi:protein TonB
MSSLLPASGQFEHVEREFAREPLGRPMLAALLFHALLIGGAAGFALLSGLFPHNTWGGANDGGAIAVQLVSNAIPLPADHPPNENVLATEKPSEAPAPPAPKAKAAVDESAIPIPTKMEPLKKPVDKKQEAVKATKPPLIPPPIASKASPHTQPNPKLDNRAQYGEQSSSQMQRSAQPTTTSANGQVTVTAGSRGFSYPYYVEGIQRKMQQNTNRNEVDSRTPRGAQANILFTIHRDGTPADARLDKSSGSPTLDQACLRAARRVDTFGPLPSPPGDGNLSVSYYCEYN